METQPTTPSSSRQRKLVTPKSRRKGPGDSLGNGKTQCTITKFYSPTEKFSQSPSSSAIKKARDETPVLKKRRISTAMGTVQKRTVQSSGSLRQNPDLNTHHNDAHATPSRLHLVRRRLYQPYSTGDSATKKISTRRRTSRVLSSGDSSDMEEETEERAIRPRSARRSSESHLCLESQSRSIVMSSSDDSDFELHNSKKSFNSSEEKPAHPSRKSVPSSQTVVLRGGRSSQTMQLKDSIKSTLDGTFSRNKSFGDSLESTLNPASQTTQDSHKLTLLGFPPSSHEDGGIQAFCSTSDVTESPNRSMTNQSEKNSPNGITFTSAEESLLSTSKQSSTNNLPSIYLQTTIPLFSPRVTAATENASEHHLASDSDFNKVTGVGQSQPPEGHPIYNELTIDPHMDSSNFQGACSLEDSSSECSVIDQSDDELTMNRVGIPLLEAIPTAKHLDVSHISDSDCSVDGNNASESIMLSMSSLMVDDSKDFSRATTPLMNGVIDESANVSCDISSIGTDEPASGSGLKRHSHLRASEECARGVFGRPSEGDIFSDSISKNVEEHKGRMSTLNDTVAEHESKNSVVMDSSVRLDYNVVGGRCSNIVDAMVPYGATAQSTPLSGLRKAGADSYIAIPEDSMIQNGSSACSMPVSDSVMAADGSSITILEDSMIQNGSSSLSSTLSSSVMSANDSCITIPEDSMIQNGSNDCCTPPSGSAMSADGSCITISEDSMVQNGSSDSCTPLSGSAMPADGSYITIPEDSPLQCGSSGHSTLSEDPRKSVVNLTNSMDPVMDLTSSTKEPQLSNLGAIKNQNDAQIVCGSQPAECLANLLPYPKKSLLLDTVLSECCYFAEPVLNSEPLKPFFVNYAKLPHNSKLFLQNCLLQLLDKSHRWVKFYDSSGAVENLVSFGILRYPDDQNDDVSDKLNFLFYDEIADILCKMGDSPVKCVETMKNVVLDRISSADSSEQLKSRVMELINRKFVKLTDDALFSVQFCIELFAFTLNLNDKFYNITDIVRYINSLLKDVSSHKMLLSPVKTSPLPPSRVFADLSEVCRLKAETTHSDFDGESLARRANRICAAIAVWEFSFESDPSLRTSPTFRHLFINYVHAFEEQLTKFFGNNIEGFEHAACIYLGFLLKQNVAGFGQKVKWCREKMRILSKISTAEDVFEEFLKTLREPVSPVEFFVRSDFVSNALNGKKMGLSIEEKTILSKHLRPISHKKVQITSANGLEHYSILSGKSRRKNLNFARSGIFEYYKSDYPSGVEDNGCLIFNGIFLAFWQVIYLPVDGAFVSKFQKAPLDWGTEEFYRRRKQFVTEFVHDLTKRGLTAVLDLVKSHIDRYRPRRSLVDWTCADFSQLTNVLTVLGLDRFIQIGLHVLGKFDERVLGFPEMVLWNEEAQTIKFLGLKKPGDPLYPYQIFWLEKLSEFGVDAEECQISVSNFSRQIKTERKRS